MALGITLTTPIKYRTNKFGKVEARAGIAFFGSTQMSKEDIVRAGHDPFSNLWYDNYAFGVGESEMAASEDLERSLFRMSEQLWEV